MSDLIRSLEKKKIPELNVLHSGLSYEEYAAYDGIRGSDIKAIKQTPAHYAVYKNTPSKSSPALEFGKKFHYAVENGERFMANYVVEPDVDRRTKIGKSELSDFHLSVKPGQIVLRSDEVDTLIGMLKACQNHKLVGNLIKNGVRETSLWAQDDETPEILKCRPDFISEKGYMVDFKSSRDVSRGFFLNQIFSDRKFTDPFYILSAAHYAHCAKLARVCKSDRFFFIAIEKTPPFSILVYPMDSGCLAVGEEWRKKLTKTLSDCKQSNSWPGYPEAAEPVTPPSWASTPFEWEDEEENG